MAILYPVTIDELTNPTDTDTQNSPPHADQHSDANDILEALMAKVGIDGSAVVTSHDYLITQNTAKRTYPSADETKLSGIEESADVTDVINVASAGALMKTGGTMSGDLTIYDPTNDGNPQFRIGSKDADEAHIQAVYDSGAQTLDYLLISTDSGGEGDIAIMPAGNLGINVTTPAAKVEVIDNSMDYSVVKITQQAAWAAPYLGYALEIVGYSVLGGFRINAADGNNAVYKTTAGILGFTSFDTTSDITFSAGSGNYLMRIEGTGNVGIGVTVPLAKLHIDQKVADEAIPVLYLDQADVSEEIIEIVSVAGVGNAIELIGAKTLTTTEFIKVTINGNTRYIPAGTIA